MKLKAVSGITLTLFLIGMLAGTSNVASASNSWWNDDWQNRRKIDIIENSGYNLIDFPVEVTFQHNGHAQPDGDDMRIIDDGIEIPSSSTNINSSHSTIMFETDILASSTKSLYVYYGNPTAIAPNYPLVPLTISEGTTGYAIIDNSVYIGWGHTIWAGTGSQVTIWMDYQIDFDRNGDPRDNYDLITDYGSRGGGIGRLGWHFHHQGLGDYQRYVQTPIYVDIVFSDASLKVYKSHTWVETTQADELWMFNPSWNYAKYQNGPEENIVDGLNTNGPAWDPLWNILYYSPIEPGWMAYRDSNTGVVFSAIGFGIGQYYNYSLRAKETGDWDRRIYFDLNDTLLVWRDEPVDPYDQPSDCKIYWYGDNSNNYTKTEETATILNNQPSVLVGNEEYPPTPPPPVGGKATPINIGFEPEIQTSWILLTAIILPLLATVVYVKFKKKKQ